jgi:NADH-quinone oxidoreductase subunit L
LDQIGTAALLSLFLPLAAFIFLMFSERILAQWAAWIGVVVSGASFLLSECNFMSVWYGHAFVAQWTWFSLADGINFKVGILIDKQASVMAVVVTLVALLVNIYSIEYKKGDRHYNRFFAYLGIFVFAMLGVVMADNLLIIFIFWELVGFASYLLIGFWFDKEKAVQANKKAFLVNRVSDVFFLMGLMILWSDYGTLALSSMHHSGWAALCIFIGCMGKSAQFPFQLWLPDAMEGPTPVSALIHAATMVAAGVYLMIRVSFLITPDVSLFIAAIGAITALIGAFSAITQYDLKRVLAFSTISQLGMMMAGIGIGAYEGAFFHLVTHAFFKACLFLCAGSVIHAFHHVHKALEQTEKRFYFDKQDMRSMGGVLKLMPLTCIAFVVSGAALAGLPLFSGFISKDAILTASLNKALESGNALYSIITISLFATAGMTAFYIFRLLFMVFGGELKIKKLLEQNQLHLHENSRLMTVPLLLLAALSVSFVFSFNPFSGFSGWLMSGFAHTTNSGANYASNHWTVAVITIILSISGVALSNYLYNNKTQQDKLTFRQKLSTRFAMVYRLSFHQFYLDRVMMIVFVNPTLQFSGAMYKMDQLVVDRLVNWVGISNVVLANILAWFDRTFVDGLVTLVTVISNLFGNITRQMQGGNVQRYFLWVFLGLLILVVIPMLL